MHQLDHSVLIDVRSVKRHVRTRLHFTSESHIHSLFNVLRWGSNPDDGTPSIFSDAAHQLSNHMELGYLTHIVFRVLQTPRSDPTEASSYRVQARPTHASPTTHLPRISHVSPTNLPRISTLSLPSPLLLSPSLTARASSSSGRRSSSRPASSTTRSCATPRQTRRSGRWPPPPAATSRCSMPSRRRRHSSSHPREPTGFQTRSLRTWRHLI